jgi:hypothetical protein
MSRELIEVSNRIDEQFDIADIEIDVEVEAILESILNLFV